LTGARVGPLTGAKVGALTGVLVGTGVGPVAATGADGPEGAKPNEGLAEGRWEGAGVASTAMRVGTTDLVGCWVSVVGAADLVGDAEGAGGVKEGYKDGVREGAELGLRVGNGVAVGELETTGATDGDWDFDGCGVEGEREGKWDGLLEGVLDGAKVMPITGSDVGDCEGDKNDGCKLGSWDLVGCEVPVGTPEGASVEVGLPVAVGPDDGNREGAEDLSTIGTSEGRNDGGSVKVGVKLGRSVRVGLEVAVGVAEGVSDRVGATERDGDVDGSRDGADDGEVGPPPPRTGESLGLDDGDIDGSRVGSTLGKREEVGSAVDVGASEGAFVLVGALERLGAWDGDSDGL